MANINELLVKCQKMSDRTLASSTHEMIKAMGLTNAFFKNMSQNNCLHGYKRLITCIYIFEAFF